MAILIIIVIVILFLIIISTSGKSEVQKSKPTSTAIDYSNPVIWDAYMKSIGVDTANRTSNKRSKKYEAKDIESKYLFPKKDAQPNNSGFYKKKVVFTGDLNNFNRNELAEKLWMIGKAMNHSNLEL